MSSSLCDFGGSKAFLQKCQFDHWKNVFQIIFGYPKCIIQNTCLKHFKSNLPTEKSRNSDAFIFRVIVKNVSLMSCFFYREIEVSRPGNLYSKTYGTYLHICIIFFCYFEAFRSAILEVQSILAKSANLIMEKYVRVFKIILGYLKRRIWRWIRIR